MLESIYQMHCVLVTPSCLKSIFVITIIIISSIFVILHILFCDFTSSIFFFFYITFDFISQD